MSRFFHARTPGERKNMKKRPLAYITAPWGENESENAKLADRYCRAVYDAGYNPCCPLVQQARFLRDAIPQEHKDGLDMAIKDECAFCQMRRGYDYLIQRRKQDFDLVQRIRGLDTRTAPKQDAVYLFSGVLICGCCGSRMTRKTNRVNGKEYHYYYCPTGKKHGCANPVMLKESKLIDCVQESLKAYIQNVASLETLLNSIDQSSINQALAKEYTDHIAENERWLEQAQAYKSRLYENLVEGLITKEEYASYKAKYTRQAEEIRAAIATLKEKLTDVLENRSVRNRWITHFTKFESMETLDRKALIHMVQSIRVQGKNELDIRFNYKDEYEKALRLIALTAQEAELSIPELLRKAG